MKKKLKVRQRGLGEGRREGVSPGVHKSRGFPHEEARTRSLYPSSECRRLPFPLGL
jgi:hypothetical protein